MVALGNEREFGLNDKGEMGDIQGAGTFSPGKRCKWASPRGN
jgi:hypothetical protein